MTRRHLAWTFLLLSTLVFGGPARAQATAADPATFIGDFAQKAIVDILAANIPNTERQQRFRTMFKEYFDVPAIGRFVLGRYSRNVQPADQEMFNALFEDVIVYTWSRRFSDYNGQSLKVSTASPDGDDGAIVKSTVVDKQGENILVDWRVRKRAAGLKAIDVIVAGVSMAITYRQEYTTIIAQDGGLVALLAQLQRQVADLKRQQPA